MSRLLYAIWVKNGDCGRQHKAPPPLRKFHILMSESVKMLHDKGILQILIKLGTLR